LEALRINLAPHFGISRQQHLKAAIQSKSILCEVGAHPSTGVGVGFKELERAPRAVERAGASETSDACAYNDDGSAHGA